MEEKRSLVRRQADRDVIELIEAKTGSKPAQLVRDRKLRQAIRHTCKAVIKLDISHKSHELDDWTTDQQTLRGRVLDLSEGGASIFTKYELKPGAEFLLGVKIYDGTTIEAKAKVRWSKFKQAKDGYATGAEFTQVDRKNTARLKTFLKELDATLGM